MTWWLLCNILHLINYNVFDAQLGTRDDAVARLLLALRSAMYDIGSETTCMLSRSSRRKIRGI